MNRFSLTCLVLTIFCVSVLDIALAEEVRGSGQGVYVQQSIDSFNLPHGGIAQRTTSSGFILADDPNNPLHRTNQNCSGTYNIVLGWEDGKQINTWEGTYEIK